MPGLEQKIKDETTFLKKKQEEKERIYKMCMGS